MNRSFYKAKWILPANGTVIEDGAIQVENGKIIKVDSVKNYSDISFIDFGNAVITPGFINLHCHLQFSGLKKTVKSDFSTWIIDLINQYKDLDDSKKILSIKDSINESILSGITTTTQICKEDYLEVFNQLQIKSFLFLETFSNSEESAKNEFERICKKVSEVKQKAISNVRVGVSPHSLYNVHSSFWKNIAKYSLDNGVLVHTHLAESIEEVDWLKYGKSSIDKIHDFIGWDKVFPYKVGLNPVEYLENLGALNENLTVAHLIELGEEELNTLNKNNVAAVVCPRSNLYLHNKLPNIQYLANNNVKTGIGTDSLFSNDNFNLLAEAKIIAESTNLDFMKVLDMLTINGAKVLKIEDLTGSLETGKDGDFLVFNLEKEECWEDLLQKQSPDQVFSSGVQLVRDKKLL